MLNVEPEPDAEAAAAPLLPGEKTVKDGPNEPAPPLAAEAAPEDWVPNVAPAPDAEAAAAPPLPGEKTVKDGPNEPAPPLEAEAAPDAAPEDCAPRFIIVTDAGAPALPVPKNLDPILEAAPEAALEAAPAAAPAAALEAALEAALAPAEAAPWWVVTLAGEDTRADAVGLEEAWAAECTD